jgi:hypothetical protein
MQQCQEFPAEQRALALCKMAHSVEKRVLIDKTFYQTSSFVRVQTTSEEIQ